MKNLLLKRALRSGAAALWAEQVAVGAVADHLLAEVGCLPPPKGKLAVVAAQW